MEQYSRHKLLADGPSRTAYGAVLRLRERNQTRKVSLGTSRSAMTERSSRYAFARTCSGLYLALGFAEVGHEDVVEDDAASCG